MSKGLMAGVIVAGLAIAGGVGFMWLNSKPQPPPGYKPIMPPSGYSGTASGRAAGRGYPGGGSYPGGGPGGSGSSGTTAAPPTGGLTGSGTPGGAK
jgi:hypothetical protein